MGRDEQLGQELLATKAKYQCELQNHERILNTMMAQLEANREAKGRQENQIAEFTEAVTSLMGQVHGKSSNPTPGPRAGPGGGGGRRPPRTIHVAAATPRDPGDIEGEGSDDEGQARWEERPNKGNQKA